MSSTDPIRGFRDDHRWLSNFWPAPITVLDAVWPTVEHAYQASKTLDRAERELITAAATPGRAKRAGMHVTLRPDWDLIRLDVMADLVTAKFDQHPDLAARLTETVSRDLVEENPWGDTFWGTTDGVGENHLGRILMAIRTRLC